MSAVLTVISLMLYTPSPPSLPFLEAETVRIVVADLSGPSPEASAATESLVSSLIAAGGETLPLSVILLGHALERDCSGEKALEAADHFDPILVVWGELHPFGGGHRLNMRVASPELTLISQADGTAFASGMRTDPGADAGAEPVLPRLAGFPEEHLGVIANVILGKACVLTGRFEEGAAFLEEALTSDHEPMGDTFIVARFYLGNALIALGDLQGAERAYSMLLNEDPTNFWGLVNLGNVHYAGGLLEEAVAALSSAIAVYPYHEAPYYTRGTALCHLGLQADGIEDFTRVLELRPDDARAMCNRGYARYETGDLAGAERDLLEAVSMDGGSPRHHGNLGMVYLAGDDLEAALECFIAAAALPGAGRDIIYLRGCTFCNLGRFEEGVADFTFLLADTPDSTRLIEDRCRAFYAAGYLAKAERDATVTMRLDPGRVYAQFLRAKIRYKAGDFDGAVSDLEQVIQRDPQGSIGSAATGRLESWTRRRQALTHTGM